MKKVYYCNKKSDEYLRLINIVESTHVNIITLTINDDIDIEINELLLYSKCNYFTTVLEERWGNKEEKCFNLDVDEEVADEIVKFFKDEPFEITHKNVASLMHCSTHLGLYNLETFCEKFWFNYITSNWSLDTLSIVIDATEHISLGTYTIEIIAKQIEAFLKYHFRSIYEVTREWKEYGKNSHGRIKYSNSTTKKKTVNKNKITRDFNFNKYIHINPEEGEEAAKYLEEFDKLTFMSEASFLKLCRIYTDDGKRASVKNPDLYTNVILLYLGTTFRRDGFEASLNFFDKLRDLIPWKQLPIREIKQFKIFAKSRQEYFKDMLLSLIVPTH